MIAQRDFGSFVQSSFVYDENPTLPEKFSQVSHSLRSETMAGASQERLIGNSVHRTIPRALDAIKFQSEIFLDALSDDFKSLHGCPPRSELLDTTAASSLNQSESTLASTEHNRSPTEICASVFEHKVPADAGLNILDHSQSDFVYSWMHPYGQRR